LSEGGSQRRQCRFVYRFSIDRADNPPIAHGVNNVREFKYSVIVCDNEHSAISSDRNLREQLHRGLTGFSV
jgi:hypothetical protein